MAKESPICKFDSRKETTSQTIRSESFAVAHCSHAWWLDNVYRAVMENVTVAATAGSLAPAVPHRKVPDRKFANGGCILLNFGVGVGMGIYGSCDDHESRWVQKRTGIEILLITLFERRAVGVVLIVHNVVAKQKV